MKQTPATAQISPPQWPKFKVVTFDGKTGQYETRIIEREQAIEEIRVFLGLKDGEGAEREADWLASGQVVSIGGNAGLPRFLGYTKEEFVRDQAPALVDVLRDLLESQQDGTCFNEIEWRKSEEAARNLLASLETGMTQHKSWE